MVAWVCCIANTDWQNISASSILVLHLKPKCVQLFALLSQVLTILKSISVVFLLNKLIGEAGPPYSPNHNTATHRRVGHHYNGNN